MNELKTAASPYLQQHADNPVHWRQWSPSALEEAKRTGKPILLSIGYAACHWCHVMAHESFEDDATAAVMNELFVNIKVDREERPDVDHVYMSALHAFGQRGGWPLTMFLTPDAEPFWGGTYFPKEPRYGQPAFVAVLKSVERAFRAEPDRIAQNTRAILDHLGTIRQEAAAAVTPAEMDELAARLATHMDAMHGGMQGAPKFPNPQILEFLWRAADRADVADCRALVVRALEQMSRGGIYDHLGGGFARYSVDERWLVPHFEKMLYDNAQLVELLTIASLTPTVSPEARSLFGRRVEETVDWVLREMTVGEGAFAASLDADSEGVEGKFYVWTAEDLADVLGAADAGFFGRFYDVTPDGNWEEPHGPAVSILNQLATPIPDASDAERLEALRRKLLAHRARRVRPGLDDKILTDWNGLMIAALARAGAARDRSDWIDRARTAYRVVIETMSERSAGRLRLAHSRRGPHRVKQAFALDYAALARAALALAEADDATCAAIYLREAADLLETLLAVHRDAHTGLLAMSAADAADVILRLAPTQDDAIPNAHPVALDALVRLSALTGDARWREAADALFAAVSGAVQVNFVGHVGVINALDLRLRGAEVVIAGQHRHALMAAARRTSWLDRTLLERVAGTDLPEGHPAGVQILEAGTGAAFVCRNSTCSLPIRKPEDLVAALGRA